MRGLWTPASRPRLRCSHHYAARDSFTSTLVRKTTTRPPRRRSSFTEHVFTILLTPVLAAALFVDTSWKAKQRRDWDERLATINDEIDQLRERERQLRSSVQLRNIHNGISQQRRGYSSVAYAPVEAEQDGTLEEFEMPTWEEETSLEHVGFVADRSDPREMLYTKEFSPEQLSNFRRYHRLNAITLALRMLLHLRIGPNPFYSLTTEDDPVDIAALATLDMSGEISLPTDTDRLVQMLALTRKQMQPLRRLENLFYAAPRIQAEAKRGTLPQTIQQLTADFESGNVTLPGLIDGYGKAILQSREPPCDSVYIMLIRSLSRIGSFSLAYHAAAALKSSTLPLSDGALSYMLLQIGRACDSRSFNNLLHYVANTDNPMNLIHTWGKTRVNSVDIPFPTTLNPRLLMALVYVSLRCGQPERAEAWLSLLREADYGSVWKDNLFRSFLAYHSFNGNWEEGKKWLHRCVDHALSIANQSIDRLARVIYRMLDLCVRCRKLAEYTAILDAAVESGIGPPLINNSKNDSRTFHPRTRSILLEWEGLPLPDNSDECSAEQKARSFQYACKSLVKELVQTPQTGKIEQERHNDITLTATSASEPHQRYAVRSRGHIDPVPSQVTERVMEEFNKLQSKVTEQEDLISEMKARFDLSIRRQKSYEEEAVARAEMWTQSFNRVGEEVQDILKRVQATAYELKLKIPLSISRQEEETERVQRQLDHTAQMTMELQEIKERLKELERPHSLRGPAKKSRKIVTAEKVAETFAEMRQKRDENRRLTQAINTMSLKQSQSHDGLESSSREIARLVDQRKAIRKKRRKLKKGFDFSVIKGLLGETRQTETITRPEEQPQSTNHPLATKPPDSRGHVVMHTAEKIVSNASQSVPTQLASPSTDTSQPPDQRIRQYPTLPFEIRRIKNGP